jgi:cation diffusion facilitator family transporter
MIIIIDWGADMTDLIIKLFIKDSSNTAEPAVRERYGNVSSIVGIVTNTLLFIIKIVAGTLSGSIAIVADAVNNLSDSASSVVTLVGFKISGKPADEEHPFGHARMEYISALIVSFIILFLGLQLMKSSFSEILDPKPTELSAISVAILVTAILLKLWQCLFYYKIGKRINSTAIIATSMDSRNDIIATSAVLLAQIITYFTGLELDGYMGVIVALFILYSGISLIRDTINPLLGMAPANEMVDEIYKKILSYDGIIGLHDLHVHKYGEGKCFASVHCEVDAKQDIMVSHDIIDNIERDFLRDMGTHLVVHLDPVVIDDERTNELKKTVLELIAGISPEIGMHDFRVVWGISHSNLIFDIVVPFGFKYSDEELSAMIAEKISKIDPTYYTVLMVDHDYIPVDNRKND